MSAPCKIVWSSMKRSFGDSDDAIHPTTIISSVPALAKYAAPDNRAFGNTQTTKTHGKLIHSNAVGKPPSMHTIKAAKTRSWKLALGTPTSAAANQPI
jgi:hypothetical protein